MGRTMTPSRWSASLTGPASRPTSTSTKLARLGCGVTPTASAARRQLGQPGRVVFARALDVGLVGQRGHRRGLSHAVDVERPPHPLEVARDPRMHDAVAHAQPGQPVDLREGAQAHQQRPVGPVVGGDRVVVGQKGRVLVIGLVEHEHRARRHRLEHALELGLGQRARRSGCWGWRERRAWSFRRTRRSEPRRRSAARAAAARPRSERRATRTIDGS